MTSGVWLTGSSMTMQSRPNTSRTMSAVITSFGGPDATITPSRMRDDVVGVPAREVEVVQHEHDGAPLLAVEFFAQVEHVDLVGDVEVGRRLVEQHQVGLLGERHRDPHPLALTARQFVDRSVGELHRAVASSAACTARSSDSDHCRNNLWCGVRPRADEVDDEDALGCDRRLGQQTESTGDLLRRQAMDLFAVEDHVRRWSDAAAGRAPAAASTCHRRSARRSR